MLSPAKAGILDLRNFLFSLMERHPELMQAQTEAGTDPDMAVAQGNADVAGGVAADQISKGIAPAMGDLAESGKMAPGTHAREVEGMDDIEASISALGKGAGKALGDVAASGAKAPASYQDVMRQIEDDERNKQKTRR